ncbi:hypothetical protein GCM10009798_16370 [Nocardioides panacihumi]|uniref:Uncharacterized protein n=1 Tax=Nocardioides panacihumi TaxID=400774 RepID=A0ABP5C7A5_9ACTN
MFRLGVTMEGSIGRALATSASSLAPVEVALQAEGASSPGLAKVMLAETAVKRLVEPEKVASLDGPMSDPDRRSPHRARSAVLRS